MPPPGPETAAAPSPPETQRRRQARADETRRALLDAALTEFAEQGYDAASTRSIAARAGSHQPQINYHFDSKEELWRAAVDHLFARLDDTFSRHAPALDDTASPQERLAAYIRAFVHAAAELPELNRIMVREATIDSARLRWIVEHHTRPRFEYAIALWRSVRADDDVADMDEAVFYYSLVGATSLAYANAPEARLFGRDPGAAEFVAAHADAVVRMFLPAQASTGSSTPREQPT